MLRLLGWNGRDGNIETRGGGRGVAAEKSTIDDSGRVRCCWGETPAEASGSEDDTLHVGSRSLRKVGQGSGTSIGYRRRCREVCHSPREQCPEEGGEFVVALVWAMRTGKSRSTRGDRRRKRDSCDKRWRSKTKPVSRDA